MTTVYDINEYYKEVSYIKSHQTNFIAVDYHSGNFKSFLCQTLIILESKCTKESTMPLKCCVSVLEV